MKSLWAPLELNVKSLIIPILFAGLVRLALVSSPGNHSNSPGNFTASELPGDTMTEEQKLRAENALKGLVAYNGLEVHVVATEPMLKNPTNIDVDDRGRIWVTEAYNYRPEINGNPTNPKGDRIIILEDNNRDGRAD